MAKRNYQTDTIYVYKGVGAPVFVTPDGIGRVFYDSEAAAEDATGATTVVWLDYEYTEWDSGDYDPDEDVAYQWDYEED